MDIRGRGNREYFNTIYHFNAYVFVLTEGFAASKLKELFQMEELFLNCPMDLMHPFYRRLAGHACDS